MAIISVIQPSINTVATRPVVWRFESNTVNIVRLILIVTDVFNTVSTIEQNPEPGTTGVFEFNISSVLSDQLSFTTSNSLTTGGIPSTIAQDTAFFNYTVRAYEVLDDGSTGYPSLADYISPVFNTHNYILTHKEWVKPFLLSDYDMSSGTGKKFLTSATGEKCITKGYSEYLAMHKVQDNATFVRDYYDSSDVFLFSQRYPVVNDSAPLEYTDQYGKIAGAGLPGSGSAGSSSLNYFDSITIDAGTGKLVDGGNGFLYGAPGRSGSILRIELATNTTTSFGSWTALGAPQYLNGVYSPISNKIYFFPDQAGDILVLDVATQSTVQIGTGLPSITSVVITPAGMIYAFTTVTPDYVLKVDTAASDAITTITPAFGGAVSTGAFYAPNGFIYIFQKVGSFWKIDTNSADALSSVAAVGWGGSPGIETVGITSTGFIYVLANDTTTNNIMKVDTNTADAVSLFSTSGTSANILNSLVGLSDDNFYLFSSVTDDVLKFDTGTDTSSIFTSTVVNSGHLFFTVIGGNQIYSPPLNGSTDNDQILDLTVTFADQIAGVDGAYVLVYIENSDLSIASEVKKYVFKKACGDNLHIHWENKFGAQDSYTFTGRVVKGFKHKSKNYLKPNGNNIGPTTRGLATLSNEVEHDGEVYSKSIKLSEVNWIQEMFYNKRAWTEEDGHLLPIILENGSVIESDSENGIYQVSFDFYYANITNGSRG